MDPFLLDLVRALVDFPEEVRVEAAIRGDATEYVVLVSPRNIAKAIGKGGRNADAVRLLAQCVARKERRTVTVEIRSLPVR